MSRCLRGARIVDNVAACAACTAYFNVTQHNQCSAGRHCVKHVAPQSAVRSGPVSYLLCTHSKGCTLVAVSAVSCVLLFTDACALAAVGLAIYNITAV
jgi:hypothetical protein